jgi:hypothetical protein
VQCQPIARCGPSDSSGIVTIYCTLTNLDAIAQDLLAQLEYFTL